MASIRRVAAIATVLLAVAGSSSAMAQAELRSANSANVREGIRIGWVRGHSVINDQNEMIGYVADFILTRDLSLFVILQIGDFLGFDKYLVAVPFKTLVLNGAHRRIHLPGATREALRNFTRFYFVD
jgi:hypothetical protein